MCVCVCVGGVIAYIYMTLYLYLLYVQKAIAHEKYHSLRVLINRGY